jgi:hypothetical protein
LKILQKESNILTTEFEYLPRWDEKIIGRTPIILSVNACKNDVFSVAFPVRQSNETLPDT